MAKRRPFEELPLLPYLIAEVVATREYTGEEMSDRIRSQSDVDRTEGKRKLMTLEQIREFSLWCERRCRNAYEARAEWFEKLIKSKSNRGRDQLYIWTSHWLAAYLHDPNIVKRDMGATNETDLPADSGADGRPVSNVPCGS